MFRHLLLLGLLVFGTAPAHSDDKKDPLLKDIRALVEQGRGNARGRAAWERISQAGPACLLPLLKAMDSPDSVASNWLRTAFDRIVEREIQAKGRGFEVERLLAFAKDPSRQGKPRRLALELVERLRPGTSAGLYPSWLEDPEFRYEAVAITLEEAQKLRSQGDKKKAAAVFQQAFQASRDMAQARKAAAGLLELGLPASVAKHMGFLDDWFLIGPFDAQGMKGFHLSYPPEKEINLKAEYPGQGKKVRWIRYRAPEAPPTAGGRHQVLINLREEKALGDADDAVAFAYTEISVPRAQVAEFRGAADDNLTVWVNGKRAFGFEEYRNGVRLDRHRFAVQLRPGKNTVLVKICQTPAPNPEPNWEFFLRIVDPTGKGIKMEGALPAQ